MPAGLDLTRHVRSSAGQGNERISLPDELYQHPLLTPSVEFPVENLFPRPEIKLAICDRNHDLASHDLPFQMGVPIILPCPVMPIPRDRFMRGKLLQPVVIILMEPRFVIVDEYRGGDMHRVH